MDRLLFRAEHSLVDQSMHAQRTIYTVNGDGFGLGWYKERPWPGVFRDVRPAWNDQNLRRLAEQISTPMFLAHVRQTTGTAVQRTNCHPFRYQNWLFQHNGAIEGFDTIRRQLDMAIAPELYPHKFGSTDTETMFFLALTHGLQDDPAGGLRGMVNQIEAARSEASITEPSRMTIAATDGEQLIVLRYSSDGHSAGSLYRSKSEEALKEIAGDIDPSHECTLILSEPLDDICEHWESIPESTLLFVNNGQVKTQTFEP
jgi:glutamine amidotransferase